MTAERALHHDAKNEKERNVHLNEPETEQPEYEGAKFAPAEPEFQRPECERPEFQTAKAEQ